MDFYLLLEIWVQILVKISKNLSSKYTQKRLDHAKKNPATDALKAASKRVIQKTAEATDDLIGNKIADQITRASKTSLKIIWKQMKKKYSKKDIYLQS